MDGSGLVFNVAMAGLDDAGSDGCPLVDPGLGAAPGGTCAGGVFTPSIESLRGINGTAILDAPSPEQAAKADVRDLIRTATAADIATVRSKIRRVASAVGTTPDALRAAVPA